ncbi:hypothetical protein ABPG77_009478 [Micractinium sp. CCAP 211/92]
MAHTGQGCAWTALLQLLLLVALARNASGRVLLDQPVAALLRVLRGVSAAAALADMPGSPPPPPALLLPSSTSGDVGWLGQGHLSVLQGQQDGGDDEVEPRILDGEPAPELEWGFMVALVSRADNRTVLCGGALLDNTTVLTAAHCVVDEQTGYPIYPLSIWAEVQGTLYPPMLILPHPDYKPTTLEDDEQDGVIQGDLHDIAVIKLALPVEGADAVALPRRRLPLRDGQQLEVAGWGKTSNSGNESQALLFADVNYLASVADCPIVPYNDTICAGNELTGARTCRGDSGGPLVLRHNATGVATVVGVVAFSPTNCTEALPFTRFTDVRQYLPQIREWQSL